MAKTKDLTIVYVGPFDELSVPLPDGGSARVPNGGTLTTTADHAKALLEQNIWQPSPAASTKQEKEE